MTRTATAGSTKRNAHRARKQWSSSARKVAAVAPVRAVLAKVAQAVGPVKADVVVKADPVKAGPVKAGPVKAGPADVVVKADAAAFVPRLIR